jgi:hypothetical protein
MTAPVAAAAAGEAGAVSTAAPSAEAATTGAGTATPKKAPAKKTTGSTRRRKPVDQGYTDALKKGGHKKGTPQPEPDAKPDVGEVSLPTLPVPSAVDTGAGVVLAALFWWWVGLPFLQGGLTGVRAQLRAKFFNKAADGSWLP